MTEKTKVQLSSVFKALREFYTIHNHVYCRLSEVGFDLVYKTLEDKLHLFLYCLKLFCVDVTQAQIVEDVQENDSNDENIFTVEDYIAIRPLLVEFGVDVEGIPLSEKPIQFIVVSLKECENLTTKDAAISKFGKNHSVSVYFDDVVSVDDHSKLRMYLSIWQAQGISLDVWNASVRSNRDKKALLSSGLSRDDCFVLDGSYVLPGDIQNRCIFWLMCNTPDKEEVTSHDYIRLYGELKKQSKRTICVSSEYLIGNCNPLAEQYVRSKRINTIESSTFPDRFIMLLAFLHVNTGIAIEFSGISYSIEDRYLRIVANLFSCKNLSVCARINHIHHIDSKHLYFSKIKDIYCPTKILSVQSSIKYSAYSWDVVLSSIQEDQKAKNNFIIYTGSYDLSREGVITEADFDLLSDTVSVYPIEELLRIIIEQFSFVSIDSLESFLYKMLRFLEQKCWQYKRISSLADVVFFEAAGKFYIGLAEANIAYDSVLYLCTDNSISEVRKTVTDILPSSIMCSEDRNSEYYKNILDLAGCEDLPSECISPFRYEDLMLRGLMQGYGLTRLPESADVFEDVIIRFYLADNYYVREHDWNKLCNVYTSYGLRDLNSVRGPLTIYGGCNTYLDNGYSFVAVYPISTENCPYQKEA